MDDEDLMSRKLSIGIVTRTRNRIVLLRRALESVKHQSYGNWRLVVVNDGGEPAPVDDLVQNIFGRDEKRVQVIHNPKSLGMEAASNVGIGRLDTDMAIIHDDDDSWAPAFLSVATQVYCQQTAKLSSIRGIVVRANHVSETVSGNHIRIDRVSSWFPYWTDQLDEGVLSIKNILVRNQFPPISFLFDLAVCKELGMFDESLPVLGDWDFHSRFVMKYDIWVHPEFLVFYHHRDKAQGVLGNSVYASASKHKHYRQILLNKWLRAALGASPSDRMLFTAIFEMQSELRDSARNLQSQIDGMNHDIRSRLNERRKTKLHAWLSKVFKSFKMFICGKQKHA